MLLRPVIVIIYVVGFLVNFTIIAFGIPPASFDILLHYGTIKITYWRDKEPLLTTFLFGLVLLLPLL